MRANKNDQTPHQCCQLLQNVRSEGQFDLFVPHWAVLGCQLTWSPLDLRGGVNCP